MQLRPLSAYPGSNEPGLFGKNDDPEMIEIFKTNVEDAGQAAGLLVLLHGYLPDAEINFDLEDCDCVLRVKGEHFCSERVIQTLTDNGFECCVLD
jgi:hypothetical protein